MSAFFVRRPIVAMVIAIVMTIVGAVAMVGLPIAQFPDIAPPEVQLSATYTGADALTIEQSVATPIEQQMSGVTDSIYMYSINANNGTMTLRVDFEVGTNINTDQILAQMRYGQAQSQLPFDVQQYGVTIKQSTTAPLALFSIYSPKGSYDALFLTNYAYININDPMTRVYGVGQVQIFGAGQYAMRMWVSPDTLAKLGVTVTEILEAIKQQNTVNPAGSIGAEPVPPGQEYTYTVRAQGRLQSAEEFENVVIRANPDGSMIRVRDVARVELGAQLYNQKGRLNGKPAAIIAIYQLAGTNAIDTMQRARELMETAKKKFPNDLDYTVSLDTTLAVTEGIDEIVKTLFEALLLVIIVVFVFLQGFRATLIPLLAVPVSLVGTFAVFPLLGFSINTLSLFGLVLAIGLVVDDAIVVVEAVEHNIEQGLSPRDATLKAMREVSAPVIAIALILPAVRGDDRGLGRLLRLQRAHAQPCAGGADPATAKGGARPTRRVLPLVQQVVRARDRWLRQLVPPPHQAPGHGPAVPRRYRRGRGLPGLATADRLRSRRGSGLLLHERAAAGGGVAAAHRRRLQADRADALGDAGRPDVQHRRRLQPAQRHADDLRRVLLRHAQTVGRAR
jgi:hydrophobic/amphiphilic exporter-1 (mainly G- bacteria), HAE1 family